jgi:hypothetical protein
VPGDVEQHAAPDDLVLGLEDAVLGGAAAGDEGRVVPVVHLPLVEDVGEAVPLGDALERHHDPVVRAAVAFGRLDVFRRLGCVAAVAEHRVDRVEALPGAALGPVVARRQAAAIRSGVM